MTRVFLHPHAGVLSAYGIGLADTLAIRERVEAPLDDALMEPLATAIARLGEEGRAELTRQGIAEDRQGAPPRWPTSRWRGRTAH